MAVGNNVWKLRVLLMTRGALFFSPIGVLFYMANGLSLAHVFYIQAAFTVASMILEIPSGYLSDRWGRRNTLIVGSAVGLLGMVVFALGTGFWEFFTANMLIAVFVSFHSGTIEAMTFDTLLEIGTSERYREIIGNQLFWSLITQSIVSILGGLLATVSLRTPFYMTILSFMLGLLIVFVLREPSRHKLQETRHFATIWHITKTSLMQNVPLRSMIALYAVLSTIVFSLMWFAQPYQTLVGLPVGLFGLAHAALTIGGAFTARMTHRAKHYVDDRWFLVFLSALVIGCYLALGFFTSLWAILFLIIGSSVFGAVNALIGDIVNKMTASDIRATVLSIQIFAFRAVYAIVAPVLGYVTGIFTLSQTLLYTGIVSCIIVLMIFAMMRRVWKQLPA